MHYSCGDGLANATWNYLKFAHSFFIFFPFLGSFFVFGVSCHLKITFVALKPCCGSTEFYTY